MFRPVLSIPFFLLAIRVEAQAAMSTTMPMAAATSMAGGMDTSAMCVPASDSPGNLTTAGIDLTNATQAMDYLSAILDDTCLQVWSNAYARAFWYGIIVVISLFTVANFAQRVLLSHRKRLVATGRSQGPANKTLGAIYGLYRGLSYTPTNLGRAGTIFRTPPLGTILMVASYVGFLMALNFIKVSTHDDQRWQSLSIRAAWLSIAQIPLIVLLTMKRNLVGWLTDVSYERLNILHRWTARGLLLTATIHFGTQSYGWARLGLEQLEWQTDTCPPTGIAAWSILVWINLSNLRPFRSFTYEVFVVQHFVSFVGFIVALMIHIPDTAEYARVYVYVAIGIYFLCKILQITFVLGHNLIHMPRATLAVASSSLASPDCLRGAITRINITGHGFDHWRPGSHVRLNIPRFGFIESHPATIASTPYSHQGDLVLFLRAHNGFTKRIARAASSSPSESTKTNYRAIVDGPYGGLPLRADVAAFPTVLLIAGSTGVTFTLAVLIDLAERVDARARQDWSPLPVRNVIFVWAVRAAEHPRWVEGELREASAALAASGVNVEIIVHATRENASGPASLDEKSVEKESSLEYVGAKEEGRNVQQGKTVILSEIQRNESDTSPPQGHMTRKLTSNGIVSRFGRPHIQSIITDTRARFPEGEMSVAVCGPSSMAEDVRSSVAGMQWGKRKRDGVWLHVEGFRW